MDADALEQTLGTVHALLDAEGMEEAASLVRKYRARAEQTGYDNWNGGTEIWEIQFELPVRDYAQLGIRRTTLEEQITARLKVILEHKTQDWYSAKIGPAKVEDSNWRADGAGLPKQIRLNIFDAMKLENVIWSGALNDVEFLSRLYDLERIRSTDSRFADAAGDIWQHCINNEDWDRDWVFTDSRFNLVDGKRSIIAVPLSGGQAR
ncbi:hypothetical protein WCQ02_41335 [Paraburkholderia tropica]|uniref:AbiJ-related protein n=1 Tax=Paraburkholderia tropica TaxID=92647 RepID=UPI0030182B12